MSEKESKEPATQRLGAATLKLKRGDAPPERTSLLFYYRDGVRVLPLIEGQRLVVGRSAPADVTIQDSSLSRQHACIMLVDGKLWVEDLGSTNGTWINGERIKGSHVSPEGDLALGTVTASLHTMAAGEAPRFGLDTHDRFVEELEAEADRARQFSRSAALLLLRGRQSDHLSRWVPIVSRLLRPFDRVALYSSDTVEVLLPELSVSEARKVAESLMQGVGKPLLCGLGVLPDHESSAGGLLEVTRRALHRAGRNTSIATPPLDHSESEEDDCSPKVSGIVAESAAMRQVMYMVDRLASSSIPVLIRGETGTGKEVIAREIHQRGVRKRGRFKCINCGAVPEQLVESTLFGHEEGAFSGATRMHKGVFESANGGTVLLDEIGELPGPVQTALLRVLETKQITRVGSSEETETDVRVLAATHRNLAGMCKAGLFREDLLYRLDVMSLEIPPLRDRADDIEPLTNHFLQMARARGECDTSEISPEAMKLLQKYDWPGNARELRNAIDRAAVITNEPRISVEDLPEPVRALAVPTTASSAEKLVTARVSLRDRMKQYEADLIIKTLEDSEWDRREAATRLGLPLRTLAHKMSQHGIRVRGR